jgi:hypothetical protein
MKAMSLFIFVLLITIVSCDKPVENVQYTSPFIELYHCADTSINGNSIRICFDSMVRDSRCPLNVNCVWQGEATIKLSLEVNGRKQTFQLSTLNTPAYRNDTTIAGCKIKLLSVTPYPGSRSESPYQVQVSISN